MIFFVSYSHPTIVTMDFSSVLWEFFRSKELKPSFKHTLLCVGEPSCKVCALVIDVMCHVASQNKTISQPNCSPWKIFWDKVVDRLFTGGITGSHTTHSFSVRALILARETGICSCCVRSTPNSPHPSPPPKKKRAQRKEKKNPVHFCWSVMSDVSNRALKT